MTAKTAPHHDNLLGICHAIGETFGFNPLYLRLALLIGVVLDAETSLVAYAVAGIAVLAAKLLTFGERKKQRSLTHA